MKINEVLFLNNKLFFENIIWASSEIFISLHSLFGEIEIVPMHKRDTKEQYSNEKTQIIPIFSHIMDWQNTTKR